ncbi:MAG: NAD(P)-dependent oxidoreductase [Alphaproteobacteria bacterium]|nr:NAD(P)-dependent oxidoreductase [Alphaproteobacteria bacterium]
MKKLGWIGLGKMGLPMAHNLARAGYEMQAYNRSRAKSDDLAAGYDKVTAVDSPAAAADGAELVISMTSDDRVLETVAIGEQGIVKTAKPGTIFVDMSTVSPMASARVASVLDGREIAFLRAPVMGSIGLAERGALLILSSGPQAALEVARDALEVLGAKLYWVGEGEQARYMKLAVNLQIGIVVSLLGEAIAFGTKGGMDRSQLIEIMTESPIGSPLLKVKGPALQKNDYSPTFDVEQMGKDLDLALATAREMETPMPMTAAVRQQYAAMISRGHGALDFSVVVQLAEELAGLIPAAGE